MKLLQLLPAAALLAGIVLGCSAQSGSSQIASPPKSQEAKRAAPKEMVQPKAHRTSGGEDPPSLNETASASSSSHRLVSNPVPTEEILMGLPTAPTIREDDQEALPEESGALRKRAKEELADGRTDDALRIIDVLLVLNPDDAEILEIRGDIMMKRDLKEDAAVDLRRCCKLGRSSCCR